MPLQIINLYLTTGNKNHINIKCKEIRSALSLESNIHTIAAGDLNFVEYDDDSTKFSPPPALLQETWYSFVTHFHLREITQPNHTFHRISPNNLRRSASSH